MDRFQGMKQLLLALLVQQGADLTNFQPNLLPS
jgi:hypothetical protein